MKVLLVNDAAAPIGGAELMTQTIRQRLRRRGHDARIFASDYMPDKSMESTADYTCSATVGPLQAFTRMANPRASRRLRQVLREFQPDVVHIRMYLTQLSPLILRQLRDYPVMFHATDFSAVCPRGTKMLPDGSACTVRAGRACVSNGCVSACGWLPKMTQLALVNRWRGHIDRVLANSHSTARILEDNGVSPVHVLWNGVPETEATARLAATPVVAYAGRLTYEKGVDLLLRAMAEIVREVPDVELWIAGQGPEQPKLEALTRELGLSEHVQFLGMVTRSELNNVLSEAWVQVVPSRWQEPFGMAAAEAMMRGTAVISGDAGGLREVVEDGVCGYLVAAGELPPLIEALRKLVTDRERAEAMGKAGRERAITHFSAEAMIDGLLAHYVQLIDHDVEVPSSTAPVSRGSII